MGHIPESPFLAERIIGHIRRLCVEISNRHVGSPGNRAATAYFAEILNDFGFDTESQTFDCLDWEEGEVELGVGEESFTAFAGPYSPPCRIKAPLVAAAEIDELEAAEARGQLLLIHGDLASEQLIPKNFPFHIPVVHPDLPDRLERKAPAAIISATARNPELAGAVYPFPLIEDGDFEIPSAYMTAEEGGRLLAHRGEEITLTVDSRRIPSHGCNVIGRKGSMGSSKMVFCAHIDAKKNTPGALDNAAGVASLLALAELLSRHTATPGVEIVALNGEDYYSAPGQQRYLSLHDEAFEKIRLAVNLDLVGYRDGSTCFSFYGCPDGLASRIRGTLNTHPTLRAGEAWYQSDHMIFVSKQRPALALTSEKFRWLCREITHTSRDTPDLIDGGKLVDLTRALHDIVCRWDGDA